MQEETKNQEVLRLKDEVIRLHDVARTLEQVFKQPGHLSDDIRNCADRLEQLIKRY